MSGQFTCSVEEDGPTLLLRLAGEFDLMAVGPVEAAFDPLSPAIERVVIDLTELTFLDASGLGTIMRAHRRAAAEGFELIVVRPRGAVNRVFTVTRTERRLTLVDRLPVSEVA